MTEPLVNVGIPTYNRPEGLRRALECITGQTYYTNCGKYDHKKTRRHAHPVVRQDSRCEQNIHDLFLRQLVLVP